MKLKIKITKEVLAKSSTCDNMYGENCAIALAIRDLFPHAWVETDGVYPFFGLKSRDGWFRLPEEAEFFIQKFDFNKDPEKRKGMSELDFEIEIPDEAIQRIDIEEVTRLLKDHPTLELATN